MAKNLKLKAARVVRDMTQADLAAAVGVSRQTINAIEKGSITLRSIFAAASAGCWERHWTSCSGRNKQ